MKRLWIFSFVLFYVSCLLAQTIPVIDVSKNYDRKRINFQDIADVNYVALETNDNVLIDRYFVIIHVSDNYIVVSNNRQGDIFVFGGNGKIKYKFNHRGQGPEDYLDAKTIVFDEKNKEVFILARHAANYSFLVYSEDGKYKRKIICPSYEQGVYACNFDDENLLVCENHVIDEFLVNKPYMLLSKKNGTVTSLNITLPQRYSNIVFWSNGGMSLVGIFRNITDGQDFIISDISCDTIFQLKRDKSLTPILRQTPSVHRTDPKVFLTSILKTEKYMFLNITKMPSNRGNRVTRHSLMYYFSNGEINEVAQQYLFHSDDFSFDLPYSLMNEVATQKNTLVYMIQAGHLHEYRSEVYGGELKKIASTIDPEDNPVLMIAKFK